MEKELVWREEALRAQTHGENPTQGAANDDETGEKLSSDIATLAMVPTPDINPSLHAWARTEHKTKVERGRKSQESDFKVRYLVPISLCPYKVSKEPRRFPGSGNVGSNFANRSERG